MPHRTKAMYLTLMALGAAGCAGSDVNVSRNNQTMWKPSERLTRPKTANCPPPKILPETYFAAGRLFEQQGSVANAIMQYRRAVAFNHQFGDAYYRLGVLLSITGQHEEATEALSRAAVLKPDSAVVHNDLGFEFMFQKSWTEAEQEFRHALILAPGYPRGHINLGLCLARQGRFEEALTTFQAVLPAPDAYYNLGLLLRGQQQYGEAADAFRRALVIDPEFSAATAQLGQIEPYLPHEQDTTVPLVENFGQPSDTWIVDNPRTDSTPIEQADGFQPCTSLDESELVDRADTVSFGQWQNVLQVWRNAERVDSADTFPGEVEEVSWNTAGEDAVDSDFLADSSPMTDGQPEIYFPLPPFYPFELSAMMADPDVTMEPLVSWYGTVDPELQEPFLAMNNSGVGYEVRSTLGSSIEVAFDDDRFGAGDGFGPLHGATRNHDDSARGAFESLTPSRSFAWVRSMEQAHDELSIIRNEIACWDDLLLGSGGQSQYGATHQP